MFAQTSDIRFSYCTNKNQTYNSTKFLYIMLHEAVKRFPSLKNKIIQLNIANPKTP